MTTTSRFAAFVAAVGLAASGSLVAMAPSAPAQAKDPAAKMDVAVQMAAGLAKDAVPVKGKGVGKTTPLDKDKKGRAIVFVAGRDKDAAKAAVTGVGGVVTDSAAGQVRAAVPVSKLDDLAKSSAVTAVRRPDEAVPLGVVSEGVTPSGAGIWHQSGRKGAGVKVGLIDVGYGGWEDAQAEGELPAKTTMFAGQCADVPDGSTHGTSMAEIVHDMAPEAELYLACVKDVMGFDDAANWLKSQGVKVVNLSLGFPGTGRGSGVPVTNDSSDPQHVVQDLRANGVLVVAAAGNENEKHWTAPTADSNNDTWVTVHENSSSQGIVAENTAEVTVELRWDAWPKTNEDLDLYVSSSNSKPTGPNDPAVLNRTSTNNQKDTPGGLTPVEKVSFTQTGGEANYWVFIKSNGARQDLRYDLTIHGAVTTTFKNPGSIAEPATSPYALAVGAITPESAAQDGPMASYSSRGPTIDGRIKPDVTGFAGVSTSTTGAGRVEGTSAAAAHVTGAAALYKGANPDLDPGQLEALLLDSSKRPGRNNDLGYGVLHTGPSRVPAPPTGNAFTSVPLKRVLDTYASSPIEPGGVRTVSIPGLPSDNSATAVVLNVQVLEASATTQVDVAANRPNRTSTLTAHKGRLASTMTIATLDPVSKSVKVRNSAGNTHVIVDMLGYFSANGSTYFPMQRPVRLDAPGTRLAKDATWTLPVREVGGISATATSALVSVSASAADAPMHVYAYGADNYGNWAFNPRPGEKLTYTYLVPLDEAGNLNLKAEAGSVDLQVDVLGYFASGSGARYVAMRDAEPLLDTTTGTGSWKVPVGADQTQGVPVLSSFRTPRAVRAAVLSLSAPTAERATDVEVSPGDDSWVSTPGISAEVSGTNGLHPPVSNTAVVPLAADSHLVKLRNLSGSTDLVASLNGYFVGGSVTPTPGAPAGVSHWKFDEGSGTTAADSAGVQSGPATLVNGAGWTDGRSGKALQLNGDQAHATANTSNISGNDISVSAWVRLDRKTGHATVIGEDGNRVSRYRLMYYRENDSWIFAAARDDADGGQAGVELVKANVPVRPGRWTHLVGTHSRAKSELRIYVDGKLAGVQGGAAMFMGGNQTAIGRGKWAGQPVDHFAGAIDDARRFWGTLSGAAVRELYQSYGANPAPRPESRRTDFDGDGRADIATFGAGTDGGDVFVSRSTSTSFTGASDKWNEFFAPSPEYPLSGDFNGDGRADAVTFTRSPEGNVYVALSDGSRLTDGKLWHDSFGYGWEIPAVGDFNGDGKDDIAVFTRGGTGDVWVALSNGSGFGTSSIWHHDFVFGEQLPAVGDVDGDGKDDLLAFDRGTTGDVWVARSNGTGFGASSKWHEFFAPGGEVPGVGDFDGDGKDDLVTFRKGSLNDALVAKSTGSSFGEASQWHNWFAPGGEIAGIADFNGDGIDDVAAFTSDGAGDVHVSLSDGGKFVQGAWKWHDFFAPNDEVPVPRVISGYLR